MSDMEISEPVPVIAELTDHNDRSLLIVEDDKAVPGAALARHGNPRLHRHILRQRVDGLAQIGRPRGLRRGGFAARRRQRPWNVVSALSASGPDARTIVLTGYGNIATAVTAVKMGAVDYLSKPADADDVVAALLRAVPRSRTAAQSNVGRSRALGAYPAHL